MHSQSRRPPRSSVAAFLVQQPGNGAHGPSARNVSQPAPLPPPPPPISPPLVHAQQARPALPQSRRSPQQRKRLVPPRPWPPAAAHKLEPLTTSRQEEREEERQNARDSPSPPPPPPTPPDTPSPPATKPSSSLGSWLQQQVGKEEDSHVAGLDSDCDSLEESMHAVLKRRQRSGHRETPQTSRTTLATIVLAMLQRGKEIVTVIA